MKIISSYGVELRKQNIPICQTLEIYPCCPPSVTCMNLYGKNWPKLRTVRNVSMRRNIWVYNETESGPV